MAARVDLLARRSCRGQALREGRGICDEQPIISCKAMVLFHHSWHRGYQFVGHSKKGAPSAEASTADMKRILSLGELSAKGQGSAGYRHWEKGLVRGTRLYERAESRSIGTHYSTWHNYHDQACRLSAVKEIFRVDTTLGILNCDKTF